MSRVDRRSFIKVAAVAAGSTILLEPLLNPVAGASSGAVYSVYDPGLVSGTAVQEAPVKAGVDACIKALTGQGSVDKAWEAVFPGITAAKRIAVKINCLMAEVSPQLAVIKALVQGLTSMLGGTFPAKNITIFDNNLAFGPLGGNRLITIYGAPLASLGIVYADPSPQYSGSPFTVRGTSKLPATYLDQADYGIDLVPLKPHQYYAGGLSGVIKNMMGACSESASSFAGASGTFHDGAPYASFVDLFKNYMRGKLHLYVADMLFAAKTENASGWYKVVNRITMGTDPCAVDAYVADVLQSIGLAATRAVPQALASAGLGTTSYSLVPVSVGPTPASRDQIDARIRDRRSSKATDAEVRQLIKSYRSQ